MNKIIVTILLLINCFCSGWGQKEFRQMEYPVTSISPNTCIDYNSLQTKIRDGQIAKKEALQKMQVLIPFIKSYYYQHGGQNFKRSAWCFPLQGYAAKAIGGKDGDGFIGSGYDYFAGNKHGGHPAQDIFINDNNQDGKDDFTKKPVNVLSVTEGIVISIETEWNIGSNLKGGKYIYIYVPSMNSFFYYAHNSKVLVQLCDIIKPGDVIATVGRTGLNAFKKRSPTHLHIMQLRFDSAYYPKPVNLFKDLLLIQIRKS
jgi:murein DD-endopeptidase MepM/ murein hydrolase activator NlpD